VLLSIGVEKISNVWKRVINEELWKRLRESREEK